MLTVEFQEQRVRLFNALLLLLASVAVVFFTLALALFVLGVIVWVEFGVKGIFAFNALGLVSTLLAYWRLRVRLKNWSSLPGTPTELRKDRDCLEGKR